jgi:hypothetical protein
MGGPAAHDGCCPSTGCNANLDGDCMAVCGNGVVESGELCEPAAADGGTPSGPDGGAGSVCPTMCPNMGCTLRVLQGTGCQAQCVNAGPDGGGTITACINGDNCCPSGCNALNDNNCMPSCGNGVVEPPETCEPGIDAGSACPTAATCISDQDFVRFIDDNMTPTFACDDKCVSTPRACDATMSDGFCPSMCDSSNDVDCPPPNDRCPNAIDISPGGVFIVNIPPATKQDSNAACSAAGPEVFYSFTLSTAEPQQLVYLSALDIPVTGNPVNLAIELYSGACPPPAGTGSLIGCDGGPAGQRACARTPFPLVATNNGGVLAGKPLNPGVKYFIAVRSFGGPGQWNLTFHHVPMQCAAEGELVPSATQPVFIQGTTCSHGDEYIPSCAPQALEDANFAIYKCPGQALHVTTCNGGTQLNPVVLSAVYGSMSFNGRCMPTAGSGTEIDCSNKAIGLPGCDADPFASELNFINLQPNDVGLVTVEVEGINQQTGGPCGTYSIGANFLPKAGVPGP